MSGVYYTCKVRELIEELEKEEDLFTSPRIIDKLRTLDPEREIGVSTESYGSNVVGICSDEDFGEL